MNRAGLRLVFWFRIKSSCEPQRLLKRHCLTPPRNSLVKGERIVRHDGISDLPDQGVACESEDVPQFSSNFCQISGQNLVLFSMSEQELVFEPGEGNLRNRGPAKIAIAQRRFVVIRVVFYRILGVA